MTTKNGLNLTDQTGHTINLESIPCRIVSLVPSQTELLFDLGLEDAIVGVTKFCVHPKEKAKSKTVVGGTKQVHLDRIAALNPDLILGNKEENDRAQIEALRGQYPVWLSDIVELEDAYSMISGIGAMTGRETQADQLVRELKQGFGELRGLQVPPQVSAAYLIWYRPWMAVGSETFINSMMEAAGFLNVFAGKTRYPETTLNELAENAPSVIMLSSEPYPFKEKHLAEIQEFCPTSVIKLVDGELFSWYGSRMLHALPYLSKLRTEIAPFSNIKL